MNNLLKIAVLFALSLCIGRAFALKTVTAVTVSPHGAVVPQGSSLTYTTSCTYSDSTTDACVIGNAGASTWSSYTTCYTVTSGGVATWTSGAACDPDGATFSGAGWQTAQGVVQVCYQSICDSSTILAQHVGDTFYPYITPDYTQFNSGDGFDNVPYSLNAVVGSHPQLGIGYVLNQADPGALTGEPGQFTCNWASSDPTKATIDRYGAVTAVAVGSVTLTCNPGGSGVFGSSADSRWSVANGGNGINLVITNPTPTVTQWYVRPDGGSYYDATNSPGNQCDGLSNLAAAGATSHHCAVNNLRNLYWDNVRSGPSSNVWVINGGDIVNVAPSSPATAGYNLNSEAPGAGPTNCNNSYGCYMPPIPSGSTANPTIIRGTNYAACTVDSAKSLLNMSYAGKYGINLINSQNVTLQCIELSQQAQCGGASGVYTNACTSTANYGVYGIWTSALTSEVNFTDVYVYGLASNGWLGATGYEGVTTNRLHIQGMPGPGINTDDSPWQSSNISVAGGMDMENSIVEWSGCVAEHPAIHNYPYVECRDAETGGGNAPDGIGEGNTSGKWIFNNVIMRYNWQDGFDLLHSGMQYISITNSQAYGNIGASYKIGPADTAILENNFGNNNCQRLSVPVGDQPAGSIIAGASYCRGNDWNPMSFTNNGIYHFYFNTLVGYQNVIFDFGCSYGYTATCAGADAQFVNNTVIGYVNGYNGGTLPSMFFSQSSGMPPNSGWAVKQYNYYYGVRNYGTLGTGEAYADPLLVNEPNPSTNWGTNQTFLDVFNPTSGGLFILPTSGSPLRGAGTSIAGITTDIYGATRPNPPVIGAAEYVSAPASPVNLTGSVKVSGSTQIK